MNEGYPLLSLRDSNGVWAGILQPHDSLDVSGLGLERPNEAVELVEIAEGFCPGAASLWSGIEEVRHQEKPDTGQWYEYYWVMWVHWVGGIAYRKGLGRVHKACWEKQRGEVFDLILG